MSQPVHVTTATFEAEVVQSSLPVVVDFWAPWCGPCKSIGPILDELSSAWAGKVKVTKINVDEEPTLASAFQVRGIPTLAVIQGGEIAEIQVGFRGRDNLEQLFARLGQASAGAVA